MCGQELGGGLQGRGRWDELRDWDWHIYTVCVCECCHLSRVQFFVTLRTIAHQAPLSINFPGKNTGVDCHALLQGIFPTLESNLHLSCLLNWQADSLPIEPSGKPLYIQWWNSFDLETTQMTPLPVCGPGMQPQPNCRGGQECPCLRQYSYSLSFPIRELKQGTGLEDPKWWMIGNGQGWGRWGSSNLWL